MKDILSLGSDEAGSAAKAAGLLFGACAAGVATGAIGGGGVCSGFGSGASSALGATTTNAASDRGGFCTVAGGSKRATMRFDE